MAIFQVYCCSKMAFKYAVYFYKYIFPPFLDYPPAAPPRIRRTPWPVPPSRLPPPRPARMRKDAAGPRRSGHPRAANVGGGGDGAHLGGVGRLGGKDKGPVRAGEKRHFSISQIFLETFFPLKKGFATLLNLFY